MRTHARLPAYLLGLRGASPGIFTDCPVGCVLREMSFLSVTAVEQERRESLGNRRGGGKSDSARFPNPRLKPGVRGG